MKLLEKYLINEVSTYMDNNIKFRVIGDMNGFSNKLRDLIIKLEEKTAKNTSLTQILALNYGSKDEIARAILKTKIPNNATKEQVLDLLNANLDTANIPDVDLLIRTGGEKRLSNFLLLQSAYAELYFCDTLFPDFNGEALKKIIEDFKKRNRRFGNI